MNKPKLFGIFINWEFCSMMLSNILKILLLFPKKINISELSKSGVNTPNILIEKEASHFISLIIAKKPRSEIYYNYCFNTIGIDLVCDERNISFNSYEQMLKSIILSEAYPVFVFYSSNSVPLNFSFDFNIIENTLKFSQEIIKANIETLNKKYI